MKNLINFNIEDIKRAIAFGYNTGYYNGRDKEDYNRPDNGDDFNDFILEIYRQKYIEHMNIFYDKSEMHDLIAQTDRNNAILNGEYDKIIIETFNLKINKL